MKKVEPHSGSTKCDVARIRRLFAGRHPSPPLTRQREGGWGDPRQRERQPISLKVLALAALIPSPTLAEACEKIRPNWTPGAPTSAWQEAIYLFTMLPSLLLLAASVIVLLKRSQWGGLAVVLLWSGLITFVTFASEHMTSALAISEGCIGSPTLFIGAVTAICIAMILYTLPRETRL